MKVTSVPYGARRYIVKRHDVPEQNQKWMMPNALGNNTTISEDGSIGMSWVMDNRVFTIDLTTEEARELAATLQEVVHEVS